MKIEFKNVVLHNFLSYGHSEIDLRDKGYCLVSGVNKCPKDNATSNGSGKSTWISAICWALTGETIQGVKSDIKNIYVEENECYVELCFNVDKDSYKIIRYNKPKSDLKIYINNEDKSGKGIRESEIALASYLPDLNKDLLTSVILLGQGLPNKLSSHTPSGRKEMLERLSKSDFMIEDIKNRIGERQTKLNSDLRINEDKSIKLNTTSSIYSAQLSQLIKERDESVSPNYDEEIKMTSDLIESIQHHIEDSQKFLEKEVQEHSVLSQNLIDKMGEKQGELEEELRCYNERRDSLIEEKLTIKSKIDVLKNEVLKLKSIKDVCPTCGQKIPGVIKQDTSKQEEELANVETLFEEKNKEIEGVVSTHNKYVKEICEQFDGDIAMINTNINTSKAHQRTFQDDLDNYKKSLSQLEVKLAKLKMDRDNQDKYWKDLLEKISSLTKDIEDNTQESNELNEEKQHIQEHLDVVKKMDTLVKRDFRGYLLSNVISFIDKKAKEYCVEVFGSSELDFKLDGNNIDISYCNKAFESLSGGEKQKVDLILQFAIRDMMSQYLDFSSNILCLDEIFDNLDAKSTNSVLNLIANKLNDIESLFIISHHSDELEIPYDSEIKIVKRENGISEVN